MNFRSTLIFLFVTLGSVVNAQQLIWKSKANPMLLSVNGVQFNPSGTQVVSGTNCHPATMRTYDVTTGNVTWDFTLGANFMCIMGVTFSSNSSYIAAIEEFGNAFIFDNTGVAPIPVDTINTGGGYGFCNTISPDNSKIAIGCSNGKLKIYSIGNGILVSDISAHTSWVTTAAYSPTGQYLITGGSDSKVKIWDSNGVLLNTCGGHSSYITQVKVSPDSKYIISASRDKTIKVWDIKNGNLLRTFSGHSGHVNGVDINSTGQKIVSASSDSTCKIWNFNDGSIIASFGIKDSGKVTAIAWHPSLNSIVSATDKSDIFYWNADASLSNNNPVTDQFRIYPNPTKAKIFTDKKDITSALLINVNGIASKVSVSSYAMGSILDIEAFPPGYYIVQIFKENKSSCFKIVKE